MKRKVADWIEYYWLNLDFKRDMEIYIYEKKQDLFLLNHLIIFLLINYTYVFNLFSDNYKCHKPIIHTIIECKLI